MCTQIMPLLLVILCFIICTHCAKEDAHECSLIKIPMCIEMPYNSTRMPNLLRHGTQEEAAIMAHEFLPLVDIGCSQHLRFFICSVFAPMCTSKISFGVPSCRLVCLSVRESCLPVLTRLNFTWPAFLRCDLFPQDGLCMMPPNLKPHLGNPSLRLRDTNLRNRISKPTFHRETFKPINEVGRFGKGISKFDVNSNWSLGLPSLPYSPRPVCSRARLWVPIDDEHGLCTPLCGEDFFFSAPEKNMAKIWVACWAFVCLASTSFSILTFCLDPKRFKYPERPVICLAFSYFFYSLPFVMTLFVSSEKLSCETDPGTGIRHLAVAGTSSSGCFVSFLMQYYFGLASDLWWTILTFCWFMSSGRFWGSEGLSNFDKYFHLIAWGTPGLVSVLVILFRQIDGDELTGLCFVGNLRPLSLFLFVIIPKGILVSLGTVFIVLGFLGLFRIRNVIRSQTGINNAVSLSLLSTINQDRMVGLPERLVSPQNMLVSHQNRRLSHQDRSVSYQDRMGSPALSTPTSNEIAQVGVQKLERLMMRLGIYATLSTIPAIFVLVFQLSFYFNYESWVKEASSDCHEGWLKNACFESRPRTVLSLFRLFMSLVVGVTPGVWVWSPKTFLVWRKTLARIGNFSFRKFSKSSDSNLSPQLVFASLQSTGNPTPIRNYPISNIPHIEKDKMNPLIPNYEFSRSECTVRTSGTSSRHQLLRDSESSFV